MASAPAPSAIAVAMPHCLNLFSRQAVTPQAITIKSIRKQK